MPPLTAELAGVAAVAAILALIAMLIDPPLRQRRAANRIRRHARQGCEVCRTALGLPTRTTGDVR